MGGLSKTVKGVVYGAANVVWPWAHTYQVYDIEKDEFSNISRLNPAFARRLDEAIVTKASDDDAAKTEAKENLKSYTVDPNVVLRAWVDLYVNATFGDDKIAVEASSVPFKKTPTDADGSFLRPIQGHPNFALMENVINGPQASIVFIGGAGPEDRDLVGHAIGVQYGATKAQTKYDLGAGSYFNTDVAKEVVRVIVGLGILKNLFEYTFPYGAKPYSWRVQKGIQAVGNETLRDAIAIERAAYNAAGNVGNIAYKGVSAAGREIGLGW